MELQITFKENGTYKVEVQDGVTLVKKIYLKDNAKGFRYNPNKPSPVEQELKEDEDDIEAFKETQIDRDILICSECANFGKCEFKTPSKFLIGIKYLDDMTKEYWEYLDTASPGKKKAIEIHNSITAKYCEEFRFKL